MFAFVCIWWRCRIWLGKRVNLGIRYLCIWCLYILYWFSVFVIVCILLVLILYYSFVCIAIVSIFLYFIFYTQGILAYCTTNKFVLVFYRYWIIYCFLLTYFLSFFLSIFILFVLIQLNGYVQIVHELCIFSVKQLLCHISKHKCLILDRNDYIFRTKIFQITHLAREIIEDKHWRTIGMANVNKSWRQFVRTHHRCILLY